MDLQGLEVLITRPPDQAAALAAALTAAKARPLIYSTLEIVPIPVSDAIQRTIAACDTLIFTSQNAAKLAPSVHADKPCIAIGPTTADVLRKAGWSVQSVPTRYTSEDLLALPELQTVSGRQIGVMTGRYGRHIIAPALEALGAAVHTIPLYTQACPQPTQLLHEWEAANGIDVVTVTSLACLRHLVHLLGPRGLPWLTERTLLTVSPRVTKVAADLNFVPRVIEAQSATHADVLQALQEYSRDR